MNRPALDLPKGTLVETATEAVREHIRSNRLKVGDVLPSEGSFAAEVGVSRPVMREAFHALAALKMIDVGNGRRARVGAIDGSVMAAMLHRCRRRHPTFALDTPKYAAVAVEYQEKCSKGSLVDRDPAASLPSAPI